MIQIPNLPPKEELEYKEKDFLLSLYEQWQSSSKVWFYLLFVSLVIAFPLKFILQKKITQALIAAYRPPAVITRPYPVQDLKVLKAQVLPVTTNTYSVVAQLLNPNAEVSAKDFSYEFWLLDQKGEVLKKILGKSFVLAAESKFLLVPTVVLSQVPQQVKLLFKDLRWTKQKAEIEVQLGILQKNFGTTLEGKFFVEGLVKNFQDFVIKKTEVEVVVFDSQNQNILAVNSTFLTDLKPLESRYFRTLWPKTFSSIGEIVVLAQVNPLHAGFSLEKPKNPLPSR